MGSETPTLGDLLAETIAAARGGINVGLPATVVSYDPARQTITAKPTVSGRYQDPDTDVLIPAPLPTIANVPVAFPSSSGFAITWPLFPGDTVFLVFADRSIDEWKATGAPETIPVDVRRFDLTDAVAIPGLRSSTRPIPASGWSPAAMVLEGVDVRLGSSAATSPVVLLTLLLAYLQLLLTWLRTHTHPAPGGATSAPSNPPPEPGNLGSAKVKAE